MFSIPFIIPSIAIVTYICCKLRSSTRSTNLTTQSAAYKRYLANR